MASAVAISSSKAEVVSYRELLGNPPMAILVFARMLDPIATTSIYSYMFAQLKWLSPDASDVEIATQAGLLAASKTAAKCATGLLWGRLSDRPYGGRKFVLLVSLLSAAIATTGYGLSRSFGMAIFWQIFYGSMNNTIGIIRCMVAEMETRPNHRSRALLMLPLAGSVGQLLGPLIGGLLASRSEHGFLGQYPFFAPNTVLAAMNAMAFLGCCFFVDETLETFDKKQGSAPKQCFNRAHALFVRGHDYSRLSGSDDTSLPLSPQRASQEEQGVDHVELSQEKTSLSFWKIWTPQVVCTLTAHFIIAGHISTFATTWAVFLASPVGNPSDDPNVWSLLRFTGGAGLDPPKIGILTSTFTAFGVFLQTLLPGLNDRFGMVPVWRISLCFFPFAYFLAPYSAFMASHVGHIAAWIVLSLSMLLSIVGRMGAQPAMTLLINACIPSPDARGTINVAGTVVGNLSRSIIPVAIMSIYGWGYDNSLVVLGFWVMSALACVAIFASGWVKGENIKRTRIPSAQAVDAEATVDGEVAVAGGAVR